MDATSPVPVIAATAVAVSCAWLLQRRFGAPATHARFVSIDGLRGYLAFFVFLHHACIWYFYSHGEPWRTPPSALYTQLGQAGVAAFFMITAFLFTTKLLDGRKKGVDWLRLYVSRVLRLLPLYLFALLLLAVLVMVLSGGQLQVPPFALAKQWTKWLLFTFLGAPDINGVTDTYLLMAGVTWSLPYEWMFYFILPLLALLVLPIGQRAPLPALFLALAALAWGVMVWAPLPILLAPFVSGAGAALLARRPRFCDIARGKPASLLCIACLALVCTVYDTSHRLEPLLLLSVSFALIAGGNTLFGTLSSGVSRFLGDMAYSLYLLHGLLLFMAFRFVLGMELTRSLSPLQHWLLVLGLVPLLIVGCFATFKLIEQPAMQHTTRLSDGLRRLLGRAGWARP